MAPDTRQKRRITILGMKAPKPKVVAKPSIVPAVRAKPRVTTPERETEEV